MVDHYGNRVSFAIYDVESACPARVSHCIALIGHVASKFVLLTLSGHMHLENNACVLYACMDYFNTVCVCVMMAHTAVLVTPRMVRLHLIEQNMVRSMMW